MVSVVGLVLRDEEVKFDGTSELYNSTRVNRHVYAARSCLMCLAFRSRCHKKRPHLLKWLDFSGLIIDKMKGVPATGEMGCIILDGNWVDMNDLQCSVRA